ncbi:MAG: hypothetical protein ACO3UU_02295 [Minisyncoccia bacterium]
MDNQKTDNLEDNLPMVNYIMLHRIYDILTLIANSLAKDEDSRLQISKMVEYHKEGFLLGPSPAFRAEEENGKE